MCEFSDNKPKTCRPCSGNNKERLVFWHWNARNKPENKKSHKISDTPSIKNQKQCNRNKPPTSENRNATQPNNAQPNTEQTLTQEQKVNLDILKRIINGEILPYHHLETLNEEQSRRKQKKINQVLTYISTNKTTELNELIYAGAKLFSKKIGIPSKSKKKKSKPGWGIQLETLIKKSMKTGQNDKTKENSWDIQRQKGKGNTRKITIQFEEINQKD